jgi:hypothetical protein
VGYKQLVNYSHRLCSAWRCLCVWLMALSTAFGHEVATHKRIGDAAVVYLDQYLNKQTPVNRPLLGGTVAQLQQLLQIGAENEDNGVRSAFHFTPPLKFDEPELIKGIEYQDVVSANQCASVNWGQSNGPPDGSAGCTVSCYEPPGSSLFAGIDALLGNLFCPFVSSLTLNNQFRWDRDLEPDKNSGAPSTISITNFGYVVHLLEDLGSPPHTRNDLHMCVWGFDYCDQFEQFNNNAKYGASGVGDPQQSPAWGVLLSEAPVISTKGFTTPTEFFNKLQQYVITNYYSNRSVFQGGVGPTSLVVSDGHYFYGQCIIENGVPVSVLAETCDVVTIQGQKYNARKIAHKGGEYWASCNNAVAETGCDVKKADIDQTIAREQFAELGPVIAQHVAAFIQFYAPAVTVTVQGNGTVTSSVGNGINCSRSSGTCSALFVQGPQGAPQITLTASPSTVTWGGDCASAGTSNTVTLTLASDKNCTATFNAGCAAQTICGTVVDAETGTVPLPGMFIEVSTVPKNIKLGGAVTDAKGKYSFGPLTDPGYFVGLVPGLGEIPIPSGFRVVAPDGTPLNFTVGRVPENVTVTGASDGTLVLITNVQWTQPPPPSNSPNFVASSDFSSGSALLPLPNSGGVARYWLTCFISNNAFKETTSVQLPGLKANDSVIVPCPRYP